MTANKLFPQLFLLTLLWFCIDNVILAQDTESDSPKDTTTLVKKNKLTLLPAIYYTPETKLAFGGLSIYTFRFKGEKPSSRPSQVQFAAIYTMEKQMLLYFPFQLFWKDEDYTAYGEVGYYKYSYNYYGVGNQQPADFEETYNVNFPRIRLNVLKQWQPNFYAGLRYWFDDYGVKVDDLEPEGQLISGEYGGHGGTVSGAGLVGLWDTRDNIFYPKKGMFIEGLLLLNSKSLGSDFNFTRFSVGVSRYFSFTPSRNHILAFKIYGEVIVGDAPFNEMALIGGTRRARGYYQGRFRENNLAMIQAEYRFPIFWRFSGAAFGSYSGVANKISNLQLRNFRYTFGAGLRFTINKQENVNIRYDYGIAKNSNGTYFTIGEAF